MPRRGHGRGPSALSTAKGITFLSLEDESGLLDLVVKPPVYPRLRVVMHRSVLVLVQGTIQRSDGAAMAVDRPQASTPKSWDTSQIAPIV